MTSANASVQHSTQDTLVNKSRSRAVLKCRNRKGDSAQGVISAAPQASTLDSVLVRFSGSELDSGPILSASPNRLLQYRTPALFGVHCCSER